MVHIVTKHIFKSKLTSHQVKLNSSKPWTVWRCWNQERSKVWTGNTSTPSLRIYSVEIKQEGCGRKKVDTDSRAELVNRVDFTRKIAIWHHRRQSSLPSTACLSQLLLHRSGSFVHALWKRHATWAN